MKYLCFFQTIWFLILLITLAVPAAAEQEVTVTRPLEEGQDASSVKDQALEQGFAQAAVQETLEILPGSLSQKRQELLAEYLKPHAQELVLSYRETTFEQTWTELFMTMEVSINRDILKKRLKSVGVFYTSQELWPYSLILSGSDPGAWILLEDLQTLSGLTVREGASPMLHLKRSEAGLWEGELTTEKRVIRERSQELEKVWFRIWSTFFNLSEVQQRVLETAALDVLGWNSMAQVDDFQKSLRKWDSLLDEMVLVALDMTPEGISAKWNIRTRDTEHFRERLAREVGSELDFTLSLKGIEKPDEMSDENG